MMIPAKVLLPASMLALAAIATACSDDDPATASPAAPSSPSDGGADSDAGDVAAPDSGVDAGPQFAGYAYAATNDATANAIVRYGRTSGGKLVELDTTPTGDRGVGSAVVVSGAPNPDAVDPLFSNDSLVLSADHRALYVVNAGSGTVTSFVVDASDGHLTRVGSYATGGTKPTSLALSGGLLYVGHAVASADGTQLVGLRVGADGSLAKIPGAAYAPSAATTVTHVLFNPSGKLLAMMELMTGTIDLYPVTDAGTLGSPTRNTSAAAGPFGGEFVTDGLLLVSEVHPGVANAGSVSSYRVSASGALTPISAAVSNGQNATCWLTATPDHSLVFASNTTSSNVSAYRLGGDGTLTLLAASAASAAPTTAKDFLGNASSGPVDAFVSSDGAYFYQQYSGLGTVAAYRIGADGALTAVVGGAGEGLPMLGAEGVVGY